MEVIHNIFSVSGVLEFHKAETRLDVDFSNFTIAFEETFQIAGAGITGKMANIHSGGRHCKLKDV